MQETADIRKRFGDEQSNLLDQFERMSFQAHLNRAILGRSLSEPGLPRSHSRLLTVAPIIPTPIPPPPPLLTNQVKQGRRRRRRDGGAASAFQKALKKLFRPILGRKSGGNKEEEEEEARDLKHRPLSCKDFSRSMRF